MNTLTEAEKAERYDWLLREIAAREPSIARLISGGRAGYATLPLQSLLRAFDIAVDDLKRNTLGDYAPRPRARVRNTE